MAWDEEEISVWTIVGPGGAGKTRLALELFERWQASWSVGFITSFHPPNDLAIIPSAPSTNRPLLAVVDYAASQGEDLRRFLEDLAQFGVCLPKVRILLLDRFADPRSGWYQRLFNYSQTAYTAGLFLQAKPYSLETISTPADRLAIFEHTLDASAEFHLNASRPSGEIDYSLLERPDLGQPLTLMMAALTAWDKGLDAALTLSRPDLVLGIARRERTRFAKLSDSKLLPHLAAHSTLCGGFDRPTLMKVAREESEALGLEYRGGFGQLADDIAEALPGSAPRSSGAIQPDIVGEAFVLDIKPDGVARAARRNAVQVVRTLTRALQDFHDPYGPSEQERSPIDALQALAWLHELVSHAKHDDVRFLFEVGNGLPHSSQALAPLALELSKKLLTIIANTRANSEPVREGAAGVLNNHAVRLSDMGEWEAALKAAEGSVSLYRQFVGAKSNRFLPGLANSLGTLSQTLSNAGRLKEALQTASESKDLYRQLVDTEGNRFLPDLAGALDGYGRRLAAMRQGAAALEAACEAVGFYRALEEAEPKAYERELAAALDSYGTNLSERGDREAALEAGREAVAIFRRLASVRPDSFTVGLASSLRNYGRSLTGAGRGQISLDASREAVELYRKLAKGRPEVFLYGLAVSLDSYGLDLGAMGQPGAAIEAYGEAVTLFRQQLDQRPEAVLPNLAISLTNWGMLVNENGQRETAILAAQEAVELNRRLASTLPTTTLPNLARSLGLLGTAVPDQGEAAVFLRESLEILLPYALQTPKADGPFMLIIASKYARACKDSGGEPDSKLLMRLVPVFELLTS